MATITDISFKSETERFSIYIDNKWCCSIRQRTFIGMHLSIGQKITCQEVKDMESFHFKNKYQNSWENEKVRIDKVSELINTFSNQFRLDNTGFGTDSNEIIKSHPDEPGAPDVSVINNNGQVVMYLEVTGTEQMRGRDYWIRPDKIQYCQNHFEKNIWIVLHYSLPQEKFVFLKPELNKVYKHTVKNISGTDEYYVLFNDSDSEVKPMEEFRRHLISLVN
jgi:hypothetical protein